MEKPTIDDALEFIRYVKKVLLHINQGRNKYDQFSSALDDFYHQRLSVEDLVRKIENLFEGCENLVLGFKDFLPKKQETKRVFRFTCRSSKRDCSYESKRKKIDDFLEKIRVRFQDDYETYYSFLEVMVEYKNGKLETKELSYKIFTLLVGHADLIYEFEGFFNDRDDKTREEVENMRVFSIDDYMNEMEVVLWNLRTSIGRVEESLKLLELDSSVSVEDPFRGLSFRCFERFYDKFDLNKIEALKNRSRKKLDALKNSSKQKIEAALKNSCKEVYDVILTQLKQKEEELLKYRSNSLDFLIEIRQMHSNRRKRKPDQVVADHSLNKCRLIC